MSAYGETAVAAARACQQGRAGNPCAAWEDAAERLLATPTLRAKNCPRSAFLGLCEEGLVQGVPAGSYTRSKKNKAYALQALRLLKKTPALASDRQQLWTAVMDGVQKQPNSQMEVVIALWREQLLHLNRLPDIRQDPA